MPSHYRGSYGNMGLYVDPLGVPPYPDQRLTAINGVSSAYPLPSNLPQNAVCAYGNTASTSSINERRGTTIGMVPGRIGKRGIFLPIGSPPIYA